MSKYNQSARSGMEITFKYMEKIMESKGISTAKLAKLIGVNRSTLTRNFKFETKMELENYFKICGALELIPDLIPADMDKNDMNFMHFN